MHQNAHFIVLFAEDINNETLESIQVDNMFDLIYWPHLHCYFKIFHEGTQFQVTKYNKMCSIYNIYKALILFDH